MAPITKATPLISLLAICVCSIGIINCDEEALDRALRNMNLFLDLQINFGETDAVKQHWFENGKQVLDKVYANFENFFKQPESIVLGHEANNDSLTSRNFVYCSLIFQTGHPPFIETVHGCEQYRSFFMTPNEIRGTLGWIRNSVTFFYGKFTEVTNASDKPLQTFMRIVRRDMAKSMVWVVEQALTNLLQYVQNMMPEIQQYVDSEVEYYSNLIIPTTDKSRERITALLTVYIHASLEQAQNGPYYDLYCALARTIALDWYVKGFKQACPGHDEEGIIWDQYMFVFVRRKSKILKFIGPIVK